MIMLIVGLVLTGLAALVHVYIFWLESVVWTGPAARRIFGVRSVEEAETTRELAYNQGFYNLFLAITVFAGIIILIAGGRTAGPTLIFVGAGSMVAASLVLLTRSGRSRLRPALVQGLLPLLGIIALTIGLVIT